MKSVVPNITRSGLFFIHNLSKGARNFSSQRLSPEIIIPQKVSDAWISEFLSSHKEIALPTPPKIISEGAAALHAILVKNNCSAILKIIDQFNEGNVGALITKTNFTKKSDIKLASSNQRYFNASIPEALEMLNINSELICFSFAFRNLCGLQPYTLKSPEEQQLMAVRPISVFWWNGATNQARPQEGHNDDLRLAGYGTEKTRRTREISIIGLVGDENLETFVIDAEEIYKRLPVELRAIAEQKIFYCKSRKTSEPDYIINPNYLFSIFSYDKDRLTIQFDGTGEIAIGVCDPSGKISEDDLQKVSHAIIAISAELLEQKIATIYAVRTAEILSFSHDDTLHGRKGYNATKRTIAISSSEEIKKPDTKPSTPLLPDGFYGVKTPLTNKI